MSEPTLIAISRTWRTTTLPPTSVAHWNETLNGAFELTTVSALFNAIPAVPVSLSACTGGRSEIVCVTAPGLTTSQ